jgi:hypothetical protein
VAELLHVSVTPYIILLIDEVKNNVSRKKLSELLFFFENLADEVLLHVVEEVLLFVQA